MNNYKIAAILFLLCIFISCDKYDLIRNNPLDPKSNNNTYLPELTSTVATAITSNSATIGSNVTSDGGASITARGVCWSNTTSPTITNYKTTDGIGKGTFISNLSGLIGNTKYYVRAYATNIVGTAYGNEISFFTLPLPISDIEGNVYNIVVIGTQVWMKENLKTTKFNDGADIPLVTSNISWGSLTQPAYCWYNNDSPLNKDALGALYNWYAVDGASNGGKNVCPIGWHVPSDNEWKTLEMFLGMPQIEADKTYIERGTSEGGKLKETGTLYWLSPNSGANNSSGFSARGAEYRNEVGDWVTPAKEGGFWWTSTKYDSNSSFYRGLHSSNSTVWRFSLFQRSGFSIRCVLD